MDRNFYRTNPIAWLLAGISVAGASLEITRMFWYLVRSVTNVLWVDQWVMLEELWRFRDGRFTLAYLWTPYWGHRIPVPRLIFLLDERIFNFSNVPLVALNVAMQTCCVAILTVTQWKLLSTKSRPLAVVMIAVTSYLLFSGLQMENLVYGMSVQYGIGYASAIAAILFGTRTSGLSFATAIICALISTLTIAAGLVLWPLLAFEIFLLRGAQRRIVALLGAGTIVSITYSAGYTQPGNGMGISGMLHHPLQAIGIASMFLGGPVSLAGIIWGQVAGVLGLVLALYLLWKCLRQKPAPPDLVALLIVVLFSVAISFSIPLARMRPEWISSFHGAAPLPSRYFTPAFLFWCCLAAARLWAAGNRIVTSACLLTLAAVTYSAVSRESAYLNDWLTFCQTLDVAGAGFIIGADDQEYMARSYPDQKLLDHWIPYARQHRLSVFSEPRATWIGQNVVQLVKSTDDPTCRLALDTPMQTGAALRISGHVDGPFQLLGPQQDLILSNSTGTVIGLGRTFVDTHHADARHRFLAYIKGSLDERSTVSLLDHQGSSRRCVTYSSNAEHNH